VFEAFRRSWSLLSQVDQRNLFFLVGASSLINVLDLIAIGLIGAVGALAIRGVQNLNPGERVNQLLAWMSLGDASLFQQIMWLSVLSVVFFLLRSGISFLSTQKIFLFLARRSNMLSDRLVRQIIECDLPHIEKRSTQMNIYALTTGTSALITGVIGSFLSLVSDLLLAITIFVGLVVIDWKSAFVTCTLFSIVLGSFYKFNGQRAHKYGKLQGRTQVEFTESLMQILTAIREIKTRHTQSFYLDKMMRRREALAILAAKTKMLPLLSKYLIEFLILILAIVVVIVQFGFNDLSRAVGNITLFLAASTRFAPALLRVQQSAVQIRSSVGSAQITWTLISELENLKGKKENVTAEKNSLQYSEQIPAISLRQVSYRYPGSSGKALSEIDLQIEENSFVAIVGRSGAGKSSLVEILLGLIRPETGEIELFGKPPQEFISRRIGSVAYVPQVSKITKGSIRENILMGVSSTDVPDEKVKQVLRNVGLEELVTDSEQGIETLVGENGSTISVGQAQRLGIARALCTDPKILILDEATSALDAQTEDAISKELYKLKGKLTLIVVAHRLSTVKNADIILYVEQGRIIASGTFVELCDRVPDFEEQVRLLSLKD
jgi:ATP-binding cassette, subfamily B, bacterial PglK